MKGFTLIEMMVVIVILGILATVTGVATLHYIDKTKVKATGVAIQNVSQALQHFYMDHGRYPERLEDLMRRPAYASDQNWRKPYLTEWPRDGWERDLAYHVPGGDGQDYDLISYGADGRPGGDGYDADLTNHRRR